MLGDSPVAGLTAPGGEYRLFAYWNKGVGHEDNRCEILGFGGSGRLGERGACNHPGGGFEKDSVHACGAGGGSSAALASEFSRSAYRCGDRRALRYVDECVSGGYCALSRSRSKCLGARGVVSAVSERDAVGLSAAGMVRGLRQLSLGYFGAGFRSADLCAGGTGQGPAAGLSDRGRYGYRGVSQAHCDRAGNGDRDL